MEIGDELIYRVKDSDESQRVQLLAVENAKRPSRFPRSTCRREAGATRAGCSSAWTVGIRGRA
ncbi:hypothetical protein PSCLAVI8L_280014 [Pseudoclavibacter sp. 8L]|nr:hypothetical protein PSCLAVI8L_280014 [Pseudoclavibacter sp. 8L]